MQAFAPDATTRHLRRSELVRLQGPLDLCACRGTLWITVDGRTEDLVLEAGQEARFGRGTALVVYALSDDACFTVHSRAGAPASWRQRLARAALGLLQRWHAARTSVLYP